MKNVVQIFKIAPRNNKNINLKFVFTTRGRHFYFVCLSFLRCSTEKPLDFQRGSTIPQAIFSQQHISPIDGELAEELGII